MEDEVGTSLTLNPDVLTMFLLSVGLALPARYWTSWIGIARGSLSPVEPKFLAFCLPTAGRILVNFLYMGSLFRF